MRTLVVCLIVAGLAGARSNHYVFLATAFSTQGTTAAGTTTHVGTVAADRSVLPFGTRIRVRTERTDLGTFVVTDTGAKVAGRHIDIYFPNRSEARRFGKRRVYVTILEWGDDKTVADLRR